MNNCTDDTSRNNECESALQQDTDQDKCSPRKKRRAQQDYPAFVQKWINDGYRVEKRKNGNFYLFSQDEYLGHIDETGLHRKSNRPRIEKAPDILASLVEDIISVSPSFRMPTKMKDCTIKEIGFTISMSKFINETWVKRYRKDAYFLFRQIILNTSYFSFLHDMEEPEEGNSQFLIAAEGSFNYHLKVTTGLDIKELYHLMGSICVISESGRNFLTQINAEQQEFCDKHGINLINTAANVHEN